MKDKASPIVALLFCVEGIEGADYTIKIEKPSGEYMKVLIPKDFEGKEDMPHGLNMVSDGHYTFGDLTRAWRGELLSATTITIDANKRGERR